MKQFEKIHYKNLNHRQKESYNYQKISAVLADYGFITYRMHDDYNGADFHAVGINDEILKIQLKGRVTIERKYLGKQLYIGFPCHENWYLYPHDDIYQIITSHSKGAANHGGRSIGYIPKWLTPIMEKYKI
jgi:hypothetical protein